MNNEILQEIKQVLTEGEFTSHMAIVETYHRVGELLLSGGKVEDNIKQVSKTLNRSERTFWYAVKFYKKYPDLNLLPEGKNLTFNKIVTKYLTTPKEKAEHICEFIEICPVCHTRKLPIDKEVSDR